MKATGSIMDRIYRLCLRCMAGIGTLFFFFFTFYSLRYTQRMYTDGEDFVIMKDNPGMHLLFLAVILLVAIGLYKAKILTERVLNMLAVIVSAVVTGAILILVDSAHAVAVSNDQLHVYLAAVEMAKGNFIELGTGEYFGVYPFQLGLSALFSVFCRFKGNAAEIIQWVQAICAGASVYVGFRITRELFHNVAVEGIYLIFAVLFLPMQLYALFLYGETFSICGICFAIWFFLLANSEGRNLKKRLLFWFSAILVMAIAYIARPSVIIVWIAMVIIQILHLVKGRKLMPLIMLAMMLIVMLSGQKVILASIEAKTGADLNRGMPTELLLAMGAQGDVEKGERPGAYNAYTWATFNEHDFNPETSGGVARQYLFDRIQEWMRNPSGAALFFKTKLLNQWNEPSYGAFSATRFMEEPKDWVVKMYYGKGNDLLYEGLNCLQFVVYLSVFICFLSLLSAREKTVCYLPGLILIGGILFSAIWEAKSRYIYPYIVVALPYASGGIIRLLNWIKRAYGRLIQKWNFKKIRKKLTEDISSTDRANLICFGLAVFLYSILMEFLFYRQALHFEGKYYTDISPYISHMQGIETGYEFPYPIMFMVGRFFCRFFAPEKAMAVALTVFNSFNAIFLKHYVDVSVRKMRKWDWISSIMSTLMTFSLLFVSMLFFDLSEASIGQRYAGVFSPNPFHNATYIAARPFSIVCFFMMTDLLQIYEEGIPKKKYYNFALFLLLSTMTKPSFSLGFIAMSAIILFYRTCRKKFKNIKNTIILASSALPAMISLLYQYGNVFVGTNSNGEESGIGFGWLTAWNTQGCSVVEAVIRGLAFPAIVMVLHWKEIRKHTALRLSLEYLGTNLAMLLCLYEKGFRMAHVNFAWGYMYAMFFAFVMCGLVVLEDTCGKKKPMFILGVQWFLFLWHLVCGLVYFTALLGGSGYL